MFRHCTVNLKNALHPVIHSQSFFISAELDIYIYSQAHCYTVTPNLYFHCRKEELSALYASKLLATVGSVIHANALGCTVNFRKCGNTQ